MADDTDPLQYASHSWILGRVSFNSSQCEVDSFVSRNQSCGPCPLTCFAVSLLSSLSSPQVLARKTTFTEAPLIEV